MLKKIPLMLSPWGDTLLHCKLLVSTPVTFISKEVLLGYIYIYVMSIALHFTSRKNNDKKKENKIYSDILESFWEYKMIQIIIYKKDNFWLNSALLIKEFI